jgi:FkbM family methyltransferase
VNQYCQIISQQAHPARFIFSRLLRLFGLWRFFKIDLGHYKLNLHPAALSLTLWVDPKARERDVLFIRRFLGPGQTYVDIGANIGQFAIVGALAVGKAGSVYAFEAHPRTAGFLRENLELNGISNTFVGQFAIGADFGWVRISDYRSDDQNSVGNSGISVPMVPLGSLVTGRIDLLKIDVEGYELFVLKGLGDKIAEVECIYFEVMDKHFSAFGYSFEDIGTFLESNGFTIFELDEDGSSARRIEAHSTFPSVRNLIALRDLKLLLREVSHSDSVIGSSQ